MSRVDREIAAVRSAVTVNAFEDFFAEHHQPVASAAYLLTGNRGDAEDIAQEALARAYERWDRVAAMESPAGYVYRIMLNLARKRWRSLAREQKSANRVDAVDQTEGIARRETIRAAVRALSVEQREALVLTEWLDLSSAEAGSLLGVSAEAVRARAHRARESLRSMVGAADE